MTEGSLSPVQVFLALSAGLWVAAFLIGGNNAAAKVLNAFMSVMIAATGIGLFRQHYYGVPVSETRDAILSFVVGGGVLTGWLAGLVLFSPVGLVFVILWLMSIPARQAAALQEKRRLRSVRYGRSFHSPIQVTSERARLAALLTLEYRWLRLVT
jgi:hypothetical protein